MWTTWLNISTVFGWVRLFYPSSTTPYVFQEKFHGCNNCTHSLTIPLHIHPEISLIHTTLSFFSKGGCALYHQDEKLTRYKRVVCDCFLTRFLAQKCQILNATMSSTQVHPDPDGMSLKTIHITHCHCDLTSLQLPNINNILWRHHHSLCHKKWPISMPWHGMIIAPFKSSN